MGKLTYNDAVRLKDAGYISQVSFDNMLANGEIKQTESSKQELIFNDGNNVKVRFKYNFGAVESHGKGFKTAMTKQILDFIDELEDFIKQYKTGFAPNSEAKELTQTETFKIGA